MRGQIYETRVRKNENAQCSDKDLKTWESGTIAIAMASTSLYAISHGFQLLSCIKRKF